MNCGTSERRALRPGWAVAALAAVLSACAAQAPPPPPPPPAPAPPPPPAMAPPPPVFIVYSGTPGVLERYPRGTEVERGEAICLKEGEQLTIIGKGGEGQRVYDGPGCLRRNAPSTSDNVGGFIFGHATPGRPHSGAPRIEAAP